MDKDNQAFDALMADFDRELGEWMDAQAPAAVLVAASVQKRLRLLRWLRVLIPVVALIAGLVLFAPLLLRVTAGVSGMVAVDWSAITDLEVLTGSLRQVPAMVWIVLAVMMSVMGVSLSER